MNWMGIILLVIGVITILSGGVRFVITAFEESAWWGLGVIFIPIVPLIFFILRFEDAWRPALTVVIGLVLVLLGSFLRATAQI